MTILYTIMTLILSNNLLMTGVKYLAGKSATNAFLRMFLVFLSFFGILANAALNDSPIDYNQISVLFSLLGTTIGIALASHFTYKVISQ